jgi:hypothetical protein
MSLTGNLEDLPLLDILQIVSFSKKTGYLTIRTDAGEAAIVFREGYVVSSFTWDSLPIDPRAASLPEEKRRELIRQRIEIALEQLIRLREGQFNFSLSDQIPGRIGPRDISQESLEMGINPQELLLDLARGIDEDRRDSSAVLEASFAEPAEEVPRGAPAQPIEEPAEEALLESAEDVEPAPPVDEDVAVPPAEPVPVPASFN